LERKKGGPVDRIIYGFEKYKQWVKQTNEFIAGYNALTANKRSSNKYDTVSGLIIVGPPNGPQNYIEGYLLAAKQYKCIVK